MLHHAILLLQAANPVPAFLDSPTVVTVPLTTAVTEAEFKSGLKVDLEGVTYPVRSVRSLGRPVSSVQRAADRVVIAGTFQGALGDGEWNPDGEKSEAKLVKAGIYQLAVQLPAGRHEYKVARGGNWGENYGQDFTAGGANFILELKEPQIVLFEVDFNERRIRDSVNHSELVAPKQLPPEKPTGPVKFGAFEVTLSKPMPEEAATEPMTVRHSSKLSSRIVPRDFLDQPLFYYNKNDLGARYSKSGTTFKVWSPTSDYGVLLLFDQAFGGKERAIAMKRGTAGVWHVNVPGDLHGKFYKFRFNSDGVRREAADVNARASNSDQSRAMVVDLQRTNPPGWPSRSRIHHTSMTDSVIYEMHVRDFTAHADAGVPQQHRGKYLGTAAMNSRTPRAQLSGLSYLADLGVTDLHLLPIQSFQFEGYSWGYATTLFNVPEETYASKPRDPIAVIKETKQMIQAIHRSGMRVVLDVVYNHTWPPEGKGSAFEQTVPYFYFRTNERGQLLNESGVGNAMADERAMVSKYIEESLVYWTQEYKVDGYRFDLLGMHNPNRVKSWVQAVRKVDRDSVIYGEPWTGGGPMRFGKGQQQGLGIAVFNDRFRGVVRGDTRSAQAAFMQGATVDRNALESALRGSEEGWGFTLSADETINYVSAHDDLTLFDKVTLSMPNATAEQHRNSAMLGTAMVLLSQGIPFLEGGVELGRTKKGNPNSYDAGDEINQFDWALADENRAMALFTKGLIQIRRNHPAFRLRNHTQIKQVMKFWPESVTGRETIAYELDGAAVSDSWKRILVIFHSGFDPKTLKLPEGKWELASDGRKAGKISLSTHEGELQILPQSATVLFQL